MNLRLSTWTIKGPAALLLGLLAGLTGCVSMPEPLREGPRQSPDPAEVRAAPDKYAGVMVRWGGVIVDVENAPEQSEIEVVTRPLSDEARPLMTDRSSGRILVRINGFIDPYDYVPGREITVVGVLEGTEQHDIGTQRYVYPVVRATSYYLWPLRLQRVYSDTYPYSPFYDPWYPYGAYYYPYPYYYPYRYYSLPHPRPEPGLRPPRLRPAPGSRPPRQPGPEFQPQPEPQLQPEPSLRPLPQRPPRSLRQ